MNASSSGAGADFDAMGSVVSLPSSLSSPPPPPVIWDIQRELEHKRRIPSAAEEASKASAVQQNLLLFCLYMLRACCTDGVGLSRVRPAKNKQTF